MKFIFRRMEEKDLDQVIEIEKVSFPSGGWNKTQYEYEIDGNTVANPYVLYLDDELIGYYSLWEMFENTSIATIAVKDKYRGKGIGNMLLSKIIEQSIEKGFTSIDLEVRKSNEPAITLYKNNGFKVISTRKEYYSNGEDAYIMVKDLTKNNILEENIILAIESSCDETAVAILRNGTELLANIVSTQISFHQKYGGVMPELASRLHIEKITYVINEALETAKLKMEDIDAIAITRGPGLIGALHVGLQAAKTLSLIYDIPLIPVHHLSGHIYANKYVSEFKYPLIALVVSGGNTELVYMEDELKFNIIGRTVDDAIGESYDKVARLLNLGYPGGPVIDKIAKEGEYKYKFPHPKVEGKYNFSYSGVKTSVLNLLQKLENNKVEYKVEDIACSFQTDAVGQLVDKTLLAIKDYGVKQVIVAGGVSANSYLREELKRRVPSDVELVIPPLWCTTDNAAMIAKAGYEYFNQGIVAGLDIGVDPTWELEDCILHKDYTLTYIEENELIENGIDYERFFYLDNLISMIDERISTIESESKKQRLEILKNQIIEENKK